MRKKRICTEFNQVERNGAWMFAGGSRRSWKTREEQEQRFFRFVLTIFFLSLVQRNVAVFERNGVEEGRGRGETMMNEGRRGTLPRLRYTKG